MPNYSPLGKPGKTNWIEKHGGLPPYFRAVIRGVARSRGHATPTDRDYETAIGTIREWSQGKNGASAKTQARAAAAYAKWLVVRAKARASK